MQHRCDNSTSNDCNKLQSFSRPAGAEGELEERTHPTRLGVVWIDENDVGYVLDTPHANQAIVGPDGGTKLLVYLSRPYTEVAHGP
jgi:hypothetical protein